MSTRVEKMMQIARQESLKSTHKKARIGVVVSKSSSILAKGFNKMRHCSVGSIRYAEWRDSIHAERDALRKIDKENLSGASIFIYRELRNGDVGLAFPCESCYRMIKEMALSRIYFSVPDYPFYNVVKL
jgi:deoxycytidylate deaminase